MPVEPLVESVVPLDDSSTSLADSAATSSKRADATEASSDPDVAGAAYENCLIGQGIDLVGIADGSVALDPEAVQAADQECADVLAAVDNGFAMNAAEQVALEETMVLFEQCLIDNGVPVDALNTMTDDDAQEFFDSDPAMFDAAIAACESVLSELAVPQNR